MTTRFKFAPNSILDLKASGLAECFNANCTIAAEPHRRHAHSSKGREELSGGSYAYPARSTTYLDLAASSPESANG